MRNSVKLVAALGVALLAAPAAEAHTFGAHGVGFAAGLGHPFSGVDHLLAMLAVGAYAVQQGGRAAWAVPAAFLAMLVAGGALGMAGVALPGVEAGILASIVVLGLAVAAAARVPLVASLGLVGMAALFHGHAHGAEMPQATSPLGYALGFVSASAILHLAGMAIARLAVEGPTQRRVLRIGGGAVAVAGLALATIA